MRVVKLDLEPARRVPGVKAVIGPGDVQEYGYEDQALLSLEPRYADQEIAAVAAVDEATARAAVRAIPARCLFVNPWAEHLAQSPDDLLLLAVVQGGKEGKAQTAARKRGRVGAGS